MKIHEVLLSVFSVFLVVMCEEHHHIEQRVLENQVPDNIKLINGSIQTAASANNNSNVSLPSVDQSAKLEQQLNSLQKPSPIPNSPIVSNASAASINTWQQTGDAQKFNLSSLLRTNASVQNGLQNIQGNGPQNIQGNGLQNIQGYGLQNIQGNGLQNIQGNGLQNIQGNGLQNIQGNGLQGVSTGGVEAPKLFPTGSSVNGTKVIQGDKEKLQTLIQQMNSTVNQVNSGTNGQSVNGSNIDTEVKDLLHNDMNASSNQLPSAPSKPVQVSEKFNDDTELIENGQNTEDKLRIHYDPSKKEQKSAFQQPYMAAILVSSLVASSVLCYAGLLVWRRYLENRYGSRTMLVEEEEFDDPNDLRHFTI